MTLDETPITLIGHPFSPIGMGEQMRSFISALAAIHVDFGVLDVFRHAQRSDPAHLDLVVGYERDIVRPGIRIFHINGDEVEKVLETFASSGHDFDTGYNIIVPAWELTSYPKVWAEHLARFDEVWALSSFIQDSLATAGLSSTVIGQSIEMVRGPLLPRRHFGIRESAFVLLHFFDLSSYATRKNPAAVIALLDLIRADDPFRDVQLVLKVKDHDRDADAWCAQLKSDAAIKVISTPLDTMGVRSLISACDCFVSLHRAEGFGRGLGEAMGLGRLAMGTDWSGNRDFMSAENSLLVRATTIPVAADEYPFWQGQEWAEPDVGHAWELLRPVLNDPARGRTIALRGQADIFRTHSHRAVGVRIGERLRAILQSAAFSRRVQAREAART